MEKSWSFRKGQSFVILPVVSVILHDFIIIITPFRYPYHHSFTNENTSVDSSLIQETSNTDMVREVASQIAKVFRLALNEINYCSMMHTYSNIQTYADKNM